MIDWISLVLDLPHESIKTGRILSIDEDGTLEYERPKAQLFEGSFESKMVFRSQGELDRAGRSTELFISGNPSKFLQGHNVFGDDHLVDLLRGVLIKVHRAGGIQFDLFEALCAIDSGIVSRIDLTESIQFSNRNLCRAYIRQISLLAHTRSGRPHQTKWTLHFQAKSRRWNAVIYSKGDEMGKHSLPESFLHSDYVKGQADALVRVEIRIKTLELIRLGCRHVYDLTQAKIEALYNEYVGRLNMAESVQLTNEAIKKLSPSIQATYLKWKAGIDVLGELTTPTFYRHRSKILNLGVDISVPYEKENHFDVMPLKQVLRGKRYEIPDEAFEKELVYQPEPLKLVVK